MIKCKPVFSSFNLPVICRKFSFIPASLVLAGCTQSDMLLLTMDKCFEKTTLFEDYSSCLDQNFFAELKDEEGSQASGLGMTDEVEALLSQLLNEGQINEEVARLSLYDYTNQLIWDLEREENQRLLVKTQTLPATNYQLDAISTSVADVQTDVDSGNFRGSQISGAIQYCIYEADAREFATVVAAHQVCPPTFGL